MSLTYVDDGARALLRHVFPRTNFTSIVNKWGIAEELGKKCVHYGTYLIPRMHDRILTFDLFLYSGAFPDLGVSLSNGSFFAAHCIKGPTLADMSMSIASDSLRYTPQKANKSTRVSSVEVI